MFNNKLKNIDINKIQANVNQPRTVFNETKIDELAASIKENGLIQPIVVRKNNGVYQIIAGERRYRACRLLNMKQVPCIIEDYTDKQTQTLAIIENIQREDLSPLEEAKAYQALIKEYDYNQTELAEIVGKKQSTIANKLRLLKLSDDVQFSLNQKQITERHARAMLSLDEEKIEELAASIEENGLIQPIVVRKVNGIYQIIAGERRYRACCSLNMKQVPCIIEDYDDKQTQTLASRPQQPTNST